ncbi:hypothetical protein RIEGSTA812A_PEG_1096 [invertebrate metagenome]|uniref:Uncharacterized protein n=1 Tax=invertebrate metagenome TaxID=1711999 RepID=A0A484H9U9_9ZZZZ
MYALIRLNLEESLKKERKCDGSFTYVVGFPNCYSVSDVHACP